MKFLLAHKHWGPVVLWMGLIFTLSTRLGSAAHTAWVIEPLLRWLVPGIGPASVNVVHTFVRKGAHLTEYAVLALLTLRAVRISLRERPAQGFYSAAGLALVIAVIYAASDEFHQSFVPGRTASPVDVLIDGGGAVVGLAVAAAGQRLRRR